MPKNEITKQFEEMMVKEYGVEFVDVTPDHPATPPATTEPAEALIKWSKDARLSPEQWNSLLPILEHLEDIGASSIDRKEVVEEALKNGPKHEYWGAGEPDCPKDIKAPNGELLTLRCKDCDEPKFPICLGQMEGD